MGAPKRGAPKDVTGYVEASEDKLPSEEPLALALAATQ